MALYLQATKDGQDYILRPTENIPVRLDVSTIESGEIGEVFSDLSQSFTFAATEEHNRFFSNAFTVGGQVVPGTSTKVPVTINSEKETLFSGSLLLNSWNESSKTYSCSLSSGIGDLSSELEDKVLADADWTALVHPYTMDQALSVNNQQTMPDYFYPLVDLGYDKGGRPFVPDDVELPNVAPTETYNESPNQHNVDYYQETYNTYGFNYQTAQSNRLISPSIYFGAIAEGPVTQGYITHPMTPLRIDQLLPAISIKSVLDRIFQQANATYEAGFLNMLSDLYILPKATAGLGFSGDFTDDKGFISTSASSYRVPDVNVNNSADKSSGGRTIWTYGADSPTVTATFNEGSNFTASTGVYVAPETGTYSFTFKCQVGNQVGTIDNALSNAYWNSRFAILVNGREIKAVDTPRIGNNGSLNGGDNYEVEIDSGDLLIYANQRVEAKWISGPSRSADDFSLEVIGPEFRTTKVPVNFNGLDINPGMQFGDTTSLDVLQALVRKLNLAIVPDKNVRGHYIIHQYYDWILSGNRVDWTERVSNIEHQPVLSDLEREIVFTDAEDDDRLNALIQDSLQDTIYGQHKYVSSSDITEGDRTVGDFFGPLINASIPAAGDITKSIVPDPQNGIPHLYEYDPADGATSMEPAIRIGYRKPIIINSEIYYSNADNSVVKYDLYSFLTLSNTNWNRSRDINFSNQYTYSNPSAQDAYNTYWKQYVDHLYKSGARKITCDVRFKPSEYTTLNINDTVHIDGNDYLINKINGFNLSRPDVVEVELITYNNNFTNVFEEPVNRFIEDDSASRTHIVGIQAIGYDGDPATADVISNAIQVSSDYFDYDGDPTTSETFTVTFATDESRYTLAASNFSSNAASLPGVSHTTLVDTGDGQVTTDITITAGSDHSYSRLEFKAEVDPLIGDNNTVNITYALTSGSSGDAMIANTMRRVIAPSGAQIPIQAIIGATAGKQISGSISNPTVTVGGESSTVVQTTGITSLGVDELYEGFVTIPLESTTDVLVTFDVPDASVTDLGTAQTSTVTITFQEAGGGIEDVSLSRTQLVATGVVGTYSEFSIISTPASGHELNAMNFSATESVAWLDMTDSSGGRFGVNTPIGITFPPSNESTTVMVNGSAQEIGAETVSTTITFTDNFTNGTLTELTETFVLVPGQTQSYTNTLTPTRGYSTTTGGVTLNGTKASSFTKSSAGGGSVNLTTTITGGDSDGTVIISGSATAEPYLGTVMVTETLPQGHLATNTLSQRFGPTDTNLSFTGIKISPNEGRVSYPNGTTFTITGGTASNYSYPADGSVVFDLSVPLSTFDGGDQSISVSISGVAPVAMASSSISISRTGQDVPAQGGSCTFQVVADGTWSVSAAFSSHAQSNVLTPTSGEAGTHAITLSLPEFPAAITTSGGAAPASTVTITATGGSATDSASTSWDPQQGTRTVTTAFSDSVAAAFSALYPNWTIYN